MHVLFVTFARSSPTAYLRPGGRGGEGFRGRVLKCWQCIIQRVVRSEDANPFLAFVIIRGETR